jgi:hypothetical protein
MADTKISAGADPAPLVATDKVPLARSASATAYAATVAEIAAYANGAYVPTYSTTPPAMDGVAAPGTASTVSRGDHKHPTDTSLLPLTGGTLTGALTLNADPATALGAATRQYVDTKSAAAGVTSFNTRAGAVTLSSPDVTTALAFTPYDAANPSGYQTAANVTTALVPYAPLASPAFTGTPSLPTGSIGVTQTAGDTSTKLATTAFVGAAVAGGTAGVTSWNTRTGAVVLTSLDVTTALTFAPAPLASPVFTGNPTAPTPTAGDNDTSIATTAFVANAVAGGTAGVASFNTRTGVVTLSSPDVTTALTFTPYNATNPSGYQTAANVTTSLVPYAPLASPALTGNPTAPTPTVGDNDTSIATTAFVTTAVAGATAGVSSWNTRTGAVVLTSGDVTTALTFTPYNSTNPSGYQTAAQVTTSLGPYALTSSVPVAASTTSPMNGVAAVGTGTTWARVDHVHASDTSRAPTASPTFTGTVTAPLTNATTVHETRVAMGANNVDCATGSFFTKTIAGATTLTVSNVPAAGIVPSIILHLTNAGSAVITWWAGMKWAGGAAPTLTAAGIDILGFYTLDAGTNWNGLVLGKDVK